MTIENIQFAVLLLFLAAVVLHLVFYVFIFSRPIVGKERQSTSSLPPVSVVLCAKNEAENLKKNLPSILHQDYPDYEVVVVNDASDDDTYYLLKIMAEENPKLKVVNLIERPNFFVGKKFPLSIGIKSASHDLVLLTDADCRPATDLWVRQMVGGFGPNTELVLGYGAYETRPGLLNKLIRFETLHTAIQYLSWAKAGMPYMGVGRNLAYSKQLFYRHNGFISHYRVVSGDDDLFVNQAANRRNTQIVAGMNNRTISTPKDSFMQWIKQKRRHLTTGSYYKPKHKYLLASYSTIQLIFYATLIILLSALYQWPVVVGAAFIRFGTQFFILKRWMKRLNERNFLLISPLMEVFTLLVNPYIMFTNPMFRQGKWK